MAFTLLASLYSKFILSGLLFYAGSLATPADSTGAAKGGNNNPTKATATTATTAPATTTTLINSSSLKGIDVSRWQKEVDWDMVKAADISFAFVKATQNDFSQDAYFHRNWEETKRVGIKRGAYHFFIPNASAQGQVNMFTSTVRMEPGDMPPVLDVEVTAPNMSGEELRENIRIWLEGVTAYYGVKPIIYTNQNYYRRWLKGYFPEYTFWMARYNTVEPDIHYTDKWMFWQYSDRGTIPGIKAAVDMNFFAGDLNSLQELCYPGYIARDENPLLNLKHMHPLQ